MIFKSIPPLPHLNGIVKEFWVYENDDFVPEVQKIIPDGFSEIIIHYGDSYRINLGKEWETQSRILYSSQISKYFYLQNNGMSGMMGIKLHPASFHELFQKDVSIYADQVIPLESILTKDMNLLNQVLNPSLNIKNRLQFAQQWIDEHLENRSESKIRNVVDMIIEKKGLIGIENLKDIVKLSTRQFERNFKKVVGLTPKFYSRIIRFNYIFEIMKEQNDSWIRTALQSGYFDQSHFIKNFKEFTGEEPSQYGFEDVNMANFFLKK